MHATRTSWLGLVATLALTGCGLVDVFGEDADKGRQGLDPAVCGKNLDTLTGLLVNPQNCVTTAECPVGSYCDSSTGTCKWDCYADSDCGVAGDCSCDGVCDGTGGTPPADPGCARDNAVLDAVATTPPDCALNEDCPFGTRCDRLQNRCVFDCRSTDHATEGCASPLVCSCLGECVDSDAARAIDLLAKVDLEVAPGSAKVVADPVTGDWFPRRIDVRIASPDQTAMDEADHTVKVMVRAGPGTEVKCDVNGTYGSECELGPTWQRVDLSTLYVGKLDAWVRPVDLTATIWTVSVNSPSTVNASRSATFSVAPPPATNTTAFEGLYEGHMELVGFVPDVAGSPDVFSSGLRVPIEATVRGDLNVNPIADVWDKSRSLTNSGRLRIAGELPGPFVAFDADDRPADTVQGVLPGVTWGGQVSLYQPEIERIIWDATIQWTNFGRLVFRLHLTRSGDLVACTSDADCDEGFACDLGEASCVHAPVWTPGTLYSPGDPTSETSFLPRARWEQAVDTALAPASAFRHSTAFLDAFVPTASIYDGETGIARADPAAAHQVLAQDVNAPSPTGLGRHLCQRDLADYVVWARETSDIWVVTSLNGSPYVCDSLLPNQLPCVDPVPTAGPSSLFTELGADLRTSCVDVHANYLSGLAYDDSATPPTYATFLAATTLSPTTLELTRGTDTAVHPIRIVDLTEPLFGRNEVHAAQGFLCLDTGSVRATSLSTERFGTEVDAASGDITCRDGRRAPGLPVAGADPGSSRGVVANACFRDLTRAAPAFAPASTLTTFESTLHSVFRRGQCFSPGLFYGALAALEPILEPTANQSTGSPAALKQHHRLLQLWTNMHAFLASQGLEGDRARRRVEYMADLGEEYRELVNAPPLSSVASQIERGFDFLLSPESRVRNLLAYPDILNTPDYRVGVPPNADDEQPVGLPVALLETTAAHLGVTTAAMREASFSDFELCRSGGRSSARKVALEQYQRALRYSAIVQSFAWQLYDAATRVPCVAHADCASGNTCDTLYSLCKTSDGALQRDATPWQTRWDSAESELARARRRAVAAADDLSACRNPLGISDSLVPLFFGDATGLSGRYFASSDYLMSGWAVPAVQQAQADLEVARRAWLDARNASIQQSMTEYEAERRLEELKGRYGRVVVDVCGMSGTEASNALDLLRDDTNGISFDTCYVDVDNPNCASTNDVLDPDPFALQDSVTTDMAQFHLCVWNKVNQNYALIGDGLLLSGAASYQEAIEKCEKNPDRGGLVPCSALPKLNDDMRAQVSANKWALVEAIVAISSGLSGYATAYVNSQDRTFTVGGFTYPLASLFELDALGNTFAPEQLGSVRADCAAEAQFQGTERPLPTFVEQLMGSNLLDQHRCFTGVLGAAFLNILGARRNIAVAIAHWENAQEAYRLKADICITMKETQQNIDDLLTKHDAFMREATESRDRGLLLATAASSVVGLLTLNFSQLGEGGLGAAAQIYAGGISRDIEAKERDLQQSISAINAKTDIYSCMVESEQQRLPIRTAAMMVETAASDLDSALLAFKNARRTGEQAVLESEFVVGREANRKIASFTHDYWLDDRIERFETSFSRARRLTYFATMAVEYEYQQSLGLRTSVLEARTPRELDGLIELLRSEQLSRTINSRRPHESTHVIGLRDQLLKLADREGVGSGYRDWDPVTRFQQRLWDPAFAVRDDDGRYLGQGVPFALDPVGELEHRCGERLWRVTASLQGDQLGSTAPAVPLFVIRPNVFASQWCHGRAGVEPFQASSLLPASTLFPDEERGGSQSIKLQHVTAMLSAWLNVPRSEFYRSTYGEGASEEFAGRGLYGDYVLLFPWKGLLENGFPLEQVEDVLLRFDYLSVDDMQGL